MELILYSHDDCPLCDCLESLLVPHLEKHNLSLVKYLMRRKDTDTLTQSINGKNAHEICALSLKRRGFYEDEISNSTVLQHLMKCGVRTRA